MSINCNAQNSIKNTRWVYNKNWNIDFLENSKAVIYESVNPFIGFEVECVYKIMGNSIFIGDTKFTIINDENIKLPSGVIIKKSNTSPCYHNYKLDESLYRKFNKIDYECTKCNRRKTI